GSLSGCGDDGGERGSTRRERGATRAPPQGLEGSGRRTPQNPKVHLFHRTESLEDGLRSTRGSFWYG
ncbi:unnamed protein product, partial [Ectocarpus sp. 12 AP-2014]